MNFLYKACKRDSTSPYITLKAMSFQALADRVEEVVQGSSGNLKNFAALA